MKRGLSIININHSSFRAVLTFVCDKGLVLKITILLEKLFANFILQILKWTEWLVKDSTLEVEADTRVFILNFTMLAHF